MLKPATRCRRRRRLPGKWSEDIVARVNDQIVTQSDYDRAAEQLDTEARQQAIPAP